jgi:tetratricopeptide (TPR) repeat protein
MRSIVETRTRTLGADHPDTIGARATLAGVLLSAGELESAERLLRATLQDAMRVDPDGARVELLHDNLANALADLERPDEALVEYELALAASTARLGPDHLNVAEIRNNLGTVFLQQLRYDQAQREFEDAVRIWKQALPANHPHIAQGLMNLARIDIAQGKPESAQSRLEPALATFEAATVEPKSRGYARFLLAQALWRAGGDKTRAAQLANAALDDYRDVPAAVGEETVREIEAFMAARRIRRVPGPVD